jgi:hypothetical protein
MRDSTSLQDSQATVCRVPLVGSYSLFWMPRSFDDPSQCGHGGPDDHSKDYRRRVGAAILVPNTLSHKPGQQLARVYGGHRYVDHHDVPL